MQHSSESPALPVCVVGGGPAGLAAARALTRHGIACRVFERHNDVGGLWDPANRGTPIYDSAHFISSKTLSYFADYPMPDFYPAYPSAGQIHAYIKDFADAYGLREHITFETEVTSAERRGHTWTVHTSDGEQGQYSALICANGTNWNSKLPHYPGEFTGDLRHSNTYVSSDEFAGQRVLIIGAGNSGCDIACDAAATADYAAISLRRGYHFLPKFVMGMPTDVFGESGPNLPLWLEQAAFPKILRLLQGDLTRLGLQEPDHKIFESHPIMNDQLLHYLGHGDIIAKPDVTRFDGQTVHFADGTHGDFDTVLCATGYNWSIPYVHRSEFEWEHGRPELYLTMFHRSTANLYALGFIETNGGAYKLFDNTADLVARAIRARQEGSPSAEKLAYLAANDHADLGGGVDHVSSDRHAHYVESHAFLKKLNHVRTQLGWGGVEPACFDSQRKEPRGAGKHWEAHLRTLNQEPVTHVSK